MDKWFKDILPDKDPYHNRGRDQMRKKGVRTSSACVLDHGFEPRSGQTKDYKIGMCCFFAKHTTLRRKSKYRLARNENNVPGWSDMSTHGLLFQ